MNNTARIKNNKRYSAYTLLELLIVMSLFMILGGLSLTSFSGLQNTVKMNEYTLNLEQNIRLAQRTAMLLERDPEERWLYGIGIDFSETSGGESLGNYTMFKWCSPFADYGDPETTSNIPNFDPDFDISGTNGVLALNDKYENTTCPTTGFENELVKLSGMDTGYSPPQSNIGIGSNLEYILFEAVSGKAFFYTSGGSLVNYESNGTPVLDDIDFVMTISPTRGASTRRITVDNLSGRITTEVLGND